MACVSTILGLPIIGALLFIPFTADPPFGRELEEPLPTTGLVLTSFVAGILSITASTLGSMLCPAAVSATVQTSSGMVLGYLAQILLFDAMPGWLTIAGAVVMLFAVIASAA